MHSESKKTKSFRPPRRSYDKCLKCESQRSKAEKSRKRGHSTLLDASKVGRGGEGRIPAPVAERSKLASDAFQKVFRVQCFGGSKAECPFFWAEKGAEKGDILLCWMLRRAGAKGGFQPQSPSGRNLPRRVPKGVPRAMLRRIESRMSPFLSFPHWTSGTLSALNTTRPTSSVFPLELLKDVPSRTRPAYCPTLCPSAVIASDCRSAIA